MTDSTSKLLGGKGARQGLFCEPERKNDPVIGEQKRRNGMGTDRDKGTFKVPADKAEHRLAVTYCAISKLKLNPKKSACPQHNADPPDRA